MNKSCYCDSGLAFNQCCEPYLSGDLPDSPVALMRSRYTAFATANTEYLLDSWHPDFRPKTLELETDQKWIGLKVYDHGEYEPGLRGWVHFVARYKLGGKAYRQEERSLFSVRNGRWYYQCPDNYQEQ